MKMGSFLPRLKLRRIIMLFLSVIIIGLHCLPVAMSDLAAERSALLSFRSAVGGRTRLWNISVPSPCMWPGVQCSDGTVTALHLPGYSLSGDIPVGTIGKLTGLKTLSLRFNYLSGPLPSDLSSCSKLRNIYLYRNRFSGELPESLFALNGLVRVNMGRNRFSGDFPIWLKNLTRIKTLYLEQNELSGSIPDLALLKLEQFNVSYNKLNGSIPESLLSMPATAFAGNSLCGGPLEACPSAAAPATAPSPSPIVINNSTGEKKGLSGGAIFAIAVGSLLAFILLVVIQFFYYRRKNSDLKKSQTDAAAAIDHLDREISGGKGIPAEKRLVFVGNSERGFDMDDLLSASAEVLGRGTFGTAYKAVLPRGRTVAVKRLKEVALSEVEFGEKIEAMGAMEHPNLVSVRAFFYSKEEKLLLYDYMPMGSLSALLHSNDDEFGRTLSWNKRLNIALGSARGIEYIHSQIPQVSHGNIKSSNILLTKSYEARVTDFCFHDLVWSSSSPYTTRLSGYRAPEVTESHRFSQQADVYSFGVLLLELVTGKWPINMVHDNETFFDLPRWVQSIGKEEWRNEVFDRQIRDENVEEKKMLRLLQLGLDCTAQYPNMRPWISEVRRKIEDLQSDRDL